MKVTSIKNEGNQLLETLIDNNILNNSPEIELDEITNIAKSVFDVPIALICLIDKDKQWIKSKIGIEISKYPKDLSFCGHTIYQDDVFIIENAQLDNRFKDNPLVLKEPNIIFYAGAPIKTRAGFNIGTLCVMDNKPKHFDQNQIRILKSLSNQVSNYFELFNQSNLVKHYKNRLSAIMENMQDGLIFQNKIGDIIDHNESIIKIFGINDNNQLNKTILVPQWKTIKEDGSDFLVNDYPAKTCLFSGNIQKDIIMGIKTPNDEIRWLSLTAVPIFEDKSKSPSYAICTFKDITERKISEDRLKLCLSSAKLGLWEWDLQSNLIWDESLYRLYEISENHFSGAFHAWENIIHPDDKKNVDLQINETIAERRASLDISFRVILPSKKIKHIQSKGFLKLDSLGNPIKAYGINWDITAEIESKQELEKFKSAINSSAIVSFTDHTGKITYVNDKFCEISSYKKEELLEKNHRILNSSFHSKNFFIHLWKTISSGKIWHGEICNKKKNGDLYWVDSYIVPFSDLSGKIDQYVSIRFDITSRKNAEKQLIYSSKMTSLGEMAGGIAHEINSPLAIIFGRIEQLLRKIENENITDKADYQKKILDIHNTVERISKIIKGLKQFSRNSENDPMEQISLMKIIDDTVSLCQEKFRNHSVTVKVSGNNDVMIYCRAAQISQALLNLLNNAFDAIENLEIKWIEINSELNTDKKKVKLSIIDSGNGIPEEIIEKIMQPFFTTKEIGKGTGLGLSISKGIIETHNGNFYFNKLSKNTSFIIELPFI
jgi:PAS domain S-box-containing protein